MNTDYRSSHSDQHRFKESTPSTDTLPPIHPGEVLKARYLDPMGLSEQKVAAALKLPAQTIRAIIEGQRPITAEVSDGLGRYLGTGAETWTSMQRKFDEEVRNARRAGGGKPVKRRLPGH